MPRYRTNCKPQPRPYNEFAILGWHDFAAGHTYPRAYDVWDEVDQRNYENGRMRAANYKQATGRLPLNSVDKIAYNTAIKTSAVGPAFWSHDRNIRGHMPTYYEGPRQHAGAVR